MKRSNLITIVLACSLATTAAAQFVPTFGEDQPQFCPERPSEPEWIEKIDIREAHTGNLVQMMYRAQGLRSVAESNKCPCHIRFPSWDEVQQHYYENYAGLERWEVLEKIEEYRRAANSYRELARSVCEPRGNW